MTHVKFIQQQQVLTMRKVVAKLGIDEYSYYSYLHSMGLEWLMYHLQDIDAVDEVMLCEVFWSWWYLNAYHRDNEYLAVHATKAFEPSRLLNDWLYYHSAKRLCDMQYKHATILFDGYANINWHNATQIPHRGMAINSKGILIYK
jgi:hypothetical protein